MMFDYFLGALPHSLAYFAAAVGLAVAFLALYVLVTPHREFALIREGNSAAATQLTGTFLGFTIPVAVVIGHSVSIPDMLLWGAVAALVQLAVFFVISRLLFRTISQPITDRCMASGIFVGGIGLGMGILQAACMVP
jgi:putative membrane protein